MLECSRRTIELREILDRHSTLAGRSLYGVGRQVLNRMKIRCLSPGSAERQQPNLIQSLKSSTALLFHLLPFSAYFYGSRETAPHDSNAASAQNPLRLFAMCVADAQRNCG